MHQKQPAANVHCSLFIIPISIFYINLISLKKFKFIVFILLFFGKLSAQSVNDSLALLLETAIETEMTQNNIPGLSASIVKEGQIVWKMSTGWAHIEDSIAVTDETLFTLASISKLFVATACAQLAEDGLLDLDADINDYLPQDIINPNFPNTPITTRQLLLHKSSLHDSESDLQLWDAPGNPIYELDEFCLEYFIPGGSLYVASNWGNTAPGNSSYWYTNAGFTLLGWIVQEVSAQPFNEYVKDNILLPLNMNLSGWNYTEVDSSQMAMPYNGSLTPYGFFSVPEYPAAMLKSNIVELSQFLIAYTQRGVYEDITLFDTTTFQMLVPPDLSNGFGWWGMDTWWGDPSGTYWSHGGFMNGVRTQLNYYPDDSSGLIILTNGEGNYQDIQDFAVEETIDTTTAVVNYSDSFFQVNENPVREIIHITIDSKTHSKLELFGIDGTKILSKSISERDIRFDVSHLKAGMYLIKINESIKPIVIL